MPKRFLLPGALPTATAAAGPTVDSKATVNHPVAHAIAHTAATAAIYNGIANVLLRPHLTATAHPTTPRCVDPLDGTVNFAHGYPSFCVSVGVIRHATPVAGCVVEFLPIGTAAAAGASASPTASSRWSTRTFTAARNAGAFVDGEPITVSRVKELRDALVVSVMGGTQDGTGLLGCDRRVFSRGVILVITLLASCA